MNFEAWLTLATIVTGIVWALDKWRWQKHRSETDKTNWFIDTARSFFPVLITVLVIRSFIFEPFRIPSRSMVPTLQVGDFIVVNKFSYGLRLPVTHTKFLPLAEPKRGDVVVFRYPQEPDVDYIKRIVGLPGDLIAYRGDDLFINGEKVKTIDHKPYTDNKIPIRGTARQATEVLPNDVKHQVITLINRRSPQQPAIRVPDGHYFAMGDNRDNSADSRVWGFVPEENLIGKAFATWLSIDFDDTGIRWSRIGRAIH